MYNGLNIYLLIVSVILIFLIIYLLYKLFKIKKKVYVEPDVLVNQEYRKYINNFINKKIQLNDAEEAGTDFELYINQILMDKWSFALYWSTNIEINNGYKITYKIESDFFKNSESRLLTTFYRKKVEIDHIFVTPYAVYLFESKSINGTSFKEMGNNLKQFKNNNSATEKTITNPAYQIKMYIEIFKELLNYFKVDLPVIGKVILKNNIIDNIEFNNSDNKDYYLYKECLHDFISINNEKYENKHREALKLIKTLHYMNLRPIAYNKSMPSWEDQ